MQVIDINCDMGEGIGNDELIMPFISSVNIACGYHAGNELTMNHTVKLAAKHKLAIGAHPSFLDKENFGRTEKNLPTEHIYDLVILQLRGIDKIIKKNRKKLHHVKPHGALYNMAARDAQIAKAIAVAVKDFNEHLILFGLSGSHLIKEAEAIGLRFANEVFADRTYYDDGSLTPRTQPGALIENADQCVKQVVKMIMERKVTSVNGKDISIVADTVCIHGDGRYAVEFSRRIHHSLKEYDIAIKAI